MSRPALRGTQGLPLLDHCSRYTLGRDASTARMPLAMWSLFVVMLSGPCRSWARSGRSGARRGAGDDACPYNAGDTAATTRRGSRG